MSLFKYSIINLTLMLSTPAFSNLDGAACLQSNFNTKVSHKGFPFGLTQNILKITKENCEVTVEHEKLKILKNKWFIDVCRAPVHIKTGSTGAIEVTKKHFSCESDAKSKSNDFCKTLTKIEKIIQDDGLIFAEGEKEDIQTDHGKMYCAYTLLRAYLRFDKVLSGNNHKLNFDLENPMKVMNQVSPDKIKQLPTIKVRDEELILKEKINKPKNNEPEIDATPKESTSNSAELGTF